MTTVTTTARRRRARSPSRLSAATSRDYWRPGPRRRHRRAAGRPRPVVLCIVFAIARPVVLHRRSTSPTCSAGRAVIVIAMGLVFVLLLGEIDLSAGFTSGVCAAVLADRC